jgi:F420-0:gamma-glutamyl ligase
VEIQSLKTNVFQPNGKLLPFILQHTKEKLNDGDILAVTSKIVSLSEGRLLDRKNIDKAQLIKEESDHYLGEIGYGCHLTIKHNLLIPSAGIDESNSQDDQYILYPEDPFASARLLHQELTTALGFKNLGILLTDSHTLPLRQGVIGTALAYWGFHGVRDMIGSPDLFGRTLMMTKINIADALASSATFLMGEGKECCPLAIVRNAPVTFADVIDPRELWMSPKLDLYAPLYEHLLTKDRS